MPLEQVAGILSPGKRDSLAEIGCADVVLTVGNWIRLYDVVDLGDGTATVRLVKTWHKKTKEISR
ncbi:MULTISPECIES: hypothetical protein [unclassified Amycolatopsis]|uniref:hypothetical protein n=1 Tax=unclassified Amycolatopsis TaxID=2618356 RepID=UPI00106E4C0F|nr:MULTISPECIES: hypothetical protein [unclassified Amycolatopsis]